MKEGGRTTGGAALAAAAHGAPARSAKLPPSPSTTLCLPQQQRARQRAAEKAIVDQDAAILQRLLGGPPAPPTDSQVQPQAQPQPQQEASPRILQPAPPPPAALEGCLSSVTLQSLMPSAQPSQQQQQSPLAVQASCSWSGGGPLAAEPSALTAYITRLEEHSSLMERQLTHLQASTSGGSAADRTPFPAPLRSARHPLAPGRREVFVLSKWLEAETQRFNSTFARKDERTPLVDFLLLAAAKARQLYGQAYAELARQVTRHCEERGRLMADVWIGYASMLDSVLSRVHAAYCGVRDRAERAEARLELAEGALAQEQAAAEAYRAEMQDEVARLRAELTAALAMGGGMGAAHGLDVAAVVMGPRGPDGHSSSGSQGSGGPPAGGRGTVRFREFSMSPRACGSTSSAASKRGTLAPSSLGSAAGRALQDASGGEDVEALQQQNAALREALDGARQELFDAYKQVADLELAAGEVVELESRAEAAEGERDEVVEQLRAATPRPPAAWDELRGLVGDEGVQRFQAALEAHKQWPTDDLAQLLCGAPLHAAPEGDAASAPSKTADAPAAAGGAESQPGGGAAPPDAAPPATSSDASSSSGSHLWEHVDQGLGCLRAAVAQGLLSRDAVKEAIVQQNPQPLLEAAAEEHAAWLAAALARPAAAPDALADFVLGSTAGGLPLSPSFYGCMHQHCPSVTFDQLRGAVQRARMSTRTRVAMLEQEVKALRCEAGDLRDIVRGYREVEARREAARRRREEEAAAEKRSPLQQYVELLGSQDEAAWSEWLIGMGQAADVPKLFRHSGKIRNRHLSKRETEKLVKEVWKERLQDPAAAAGKGCDLAEFVFQQLQKRVGIVTAVVESGYNFLFGLWKYQWDADCELFLRILLGEVKEDVYVAQVRLQEELEDLFGAVDRAKGQATGRIDKDDLRTALLAYFRVGQAGGKSLKRFDELMQAMDEDQEGGEVEWRRVFEEDREFNQGEFAESIRDQFLQERVEFFKALEEAVYDEAGHEEECGRQHVARALMRVDLDLPEKAAQQTAAAVFAGLGEGELLGVKAVMRKLSRGVVRRSRTSSIKGSVVGAAATLKSKPKRGAGPLSEACQRALEALRQEWIARELQRNQPQLPSVTA